MKKIILVESDSHHISAYRRMFENSGFDVELARTKNEMLEELREIRNGETKMPDMIVMDLMLADGHGGDVLKAVKKNFLTQNVPVFAVTNYQSREFEKEIAAAGIAPEKYLIKAHCTPDDLLYEIERHFGMRPPRPNRPKTNLA